jgi:hypothetical protein
MGLRSTTVFYPVIMQQFAFSSTIKSVVMSHLISLSAAKALIGKYKNQKKNLLNSTLQADDVLPDCETFDRDAFDALLKQDGCTRVRIYFGMDEKNRVNLVIVGVDADDNDMVPQQTRSLEEDTSVIIEDGLRCPEMCPPSSPLNS